ncbi:ABC transporter permease subunit [Pelolinea submarina]|uniref:Monosaccharide ABC transporter membrane protein (CUT2 family) n=1 Tax=Pelolinea submarina TaxID=913107 RepID=A0A347ZQ74_9CHLR|nr:sugar ABC transporter permease YjfF [Pelolinea submarina]REG06217.1 monosaccharide ABC transporter membrane protein (CUT2 family) [Pelolinea submarina]BBB47455.1 simple sugar transport system permease protein [Pelolinea submarina]
MHKIKTFLLKNGPLLATIAIFILVYAIGGQLYPAMKKPQVFLNLFINNASLLIISIGMTVVVIMGGIDLSVGAMIALSSVASAALLQNNLNPILVMVLMLLMGIGLGFVMGCIIHYLKVEAFVVTLMGQFFARGMAYVINESSVTIKNEFYNFLALTKIHLPYFEKAYVYIPTLAGIVLLIFTFILLTSTRFGRTVYAIGNNEQSALLMGLPVARTKLIVYSFSGFCSALAGIVFSVSLLSGYGGYAQSMEMDAIASVVIGGTALTGGTGTVLGTLFGVMINGIIVSILQFNGTLTSWWTRIGVGVLTLIFIGIQSLFYVGKKEK